MTKIAAYSPFRVSFGGGGTDINPFCETYGGAVVNTAIDRGVTLIYTPDEYELEISSRDFLRSVIIGKENEEDDVLHKMSMLFQGRGIDHGRIAINAGVPPGSGLGSSSALVTAVLALIYRIKGVTNDPWQIAREAFQIERDYFGVTLGKQDPFAVSLGGFKFMEFKSGKETIDRMTESAGFIKELEKRTLLVYTGKTRESSQVLREQVERSKKGSQEVVSNLLKMRDLAYEMRSAAKDNDLDRFTGAINEGWTLKKKLGKNVSNDKIDSIIKTASENGAAGVRLMGGGGEGFILAISKKNQLETLQKSLMDISSFVVRVSFEQGGTRTFEPA